MYIDFTLFIVYYITIPNNKPVGKKRKGMVVIMKTKKIYGVSSKFEFGA